MGKYPLMHPERRPDWFATEVQPHEPAVRSYLRHKYPSLDPDDIIQESYLKLFRLRALVKIRSLKAYFFAVASHTAVGVFRKNGRRPPPLPVSELPEIVLLEQGSDVAEIINDRQRLELVASALETLPPRCRAVVELTVIHDLTTTQIALQLNLAESTVRVQLARGIEKCSAFLRTRGESP